MALITRLSRMFRADMHAVLDRIEEPQQLLQQAIREMEEALLQQQQQLQRLQYERGQLKRRIDGVAQALEQSGKELDICFQSGREELARSIVKRRIEGERLCKLLAQQEEGVAERCRQLEVRIEQNRTELAAMQQKAELLAVEPVEAGYAGSGSEIHLSVSDDEVEVAFLREKQRRVPS